MASPVARETITLNAGELKHTIIKALLTSINHHYYLTALQTKFAIPMIRKHDEAELTIMYCNYMTSTNKKQDYVSLLGCLLFNNKQKLQHFLNKFGTEFLINIYLDEELLNYEEQNPLEWILQLNATRNQITIKNINDNITHIISLLDPNVTTQTPSPEIGEETSQKNDAITISPQTNYGLGMHSKNISRCQTKELDDNSFKNFSDDSNSPPSASSTEQTIQPLKIKIPMQSKPSECKKGKAMYEAKIKKEKQTCEAKNNLKRKLKNDEEEFNIDGDMTKFLEHLDHHTKDLFQSTKEVLDENFPIIYNSLATVKSFISLLGKIIKKIPHEIDPISGEIILKCKGCLLHCPQNWSLTSPPGRPTANSIKKKKKYCKCYICTCETFLAKSLYYVYSEEKIVYKKFNCVYTVQ